VEIGNHEYRYTWDSDTQKTKYLGPVGSSPPISEEEFLMMTMGLPQHTIIWGVDRDGKTRKWGVVAEPMGDHFDKRGLGWNEGQPNEDLNRKALYGNILGAKYGEEWEKEYVFIDPGELADGENFIDPARIAGKEPGERVFEFCEILYSTSVKKRADENQWGHFLAPFEEEEMTIKPTMVCLSRTKRGTPFYVIGEHIETKIQPPIQFAHKQTDSFRLWIVIERRYVSPLFDEMKEIYTRENPALPTPVTMDVMKFREDLE